MLKQKLGYSLIALVAIGAVILLWYSDAIPQNPAYHMFADQRDIYGVKNYYNVISNALFFIVGFYGSYNFLFKLKLGYKFTEKNAYLSFYVGVFFVTFGSAFYHLEPSNQTLVWDRLPMTIAFMGLFSIVIGEYLSPKVGQALLLPLIVCGAISVFYWWYGEIQGQGDLRFYVLVQFVPLLVIPIILLFFSSDAKSSRAYWMLLLAYLLAKLLEHFDVAIYQKLGFISGHSLKHIAAAVGVYWLMKYQVERHRKK